MNRMTLFLIILVCISIVFLQTSCKDKDDENSKSIKDTQNKTKENNDESNKPVEEKKIKTWRLGRFDLKKYFEEFQQYASFGEKASLNQSYFKELITDNCQIITFDNSKNGKGKTTETPADYANRLARISFTTKLYEVLLEEPIYETYNNIKAILAYKTALIGDKAKVLILNRRLLIDIIDNKLKASSVKINISDATKDEITKARKLLDEKISQTKEPKRRYMIPSGESFFASKPSITSDGKYVLFRSPPNIEGKIYILETESQKTTLLEKLPGKSCETQFFMTDNEHIFISSKIEGVRNQTMKIGEYKFNSWATKKSDCHLSAFSPVDNSVLIVTRKQNECVLQETNYEGKEFNKIISYPTSYLFPKYSSEKDKILMLIFKVKNNSLIFEILCVDVSGENIKSLVKHTDSLEVVSLLDDMERLYFVKSSPLIKLFYLNIKNSETSIVESIGNWNILDSQSSLNGQYFFFVSLADKNEHELYKMDLGKDKPEPVKLTNTGGMISDFSVSYDGQWVVFTVEDLLTETTVNTKMFIMKSNGTNKKLILDMQK